jgi:tetratricopeptide (TPR) repeat protein
VDSAWVQWRLAVALDSMGESGEALELIERALAVDPLAPPFTHSRTIIVRNLRRKLAEASAAEAGRLYERLARSGEADDEAHLTMARHHAACGGYDAALRLLEAVAVLFPACRDAWVELARVARLVGREEQARAAELEAMMLGEGGAAASGSIATA